MDHIILSPWTWSG